MPIEAVAHSDRSRVVTLNYNGFSYVEIVISGWDGIDPNACSRKGMLLTKSEVARLIAHLGGIYLQMPDEVKANVL